MNKNEYISQEEMEQIDRVEVDKKILENIKSKNQNTFSQIQRRGILNIIEKDLKENETIEFHCVGRNYTIESARMGAAASIIASAVANPIFGWNSNSILIKTNMRIIFVEATMGWQYSKHYEISQEVHLFKKKEVFYLIVDGDDKKTIIEYNNEVYDLVMDSIRDKANIISDEKFEGSKELKVGIAIGYLYIIPGILVVIAAIIAIICSDTSSFMYK